MPSGSVSGGVIPKKDPPTVLSLRKQLKKRFYLGQLAQTCDSTHPPHEKEKFGTYTEVIFTVNLLEISGKKGSNMR